MVALACILLFGSSTFEFPGGPPGDLVSLIGEKAEGPAVLLLDSEADLPKARFAYDGKAELLSGLQKPFGLVQYGTGRAGLGPKAWPLYLFPPIGVPVPNLAFDGFDISRETTLANGQFTGWTRGRAAVRLADLAGHLRWAKPVAMHWFFKETRVSFRATATPEVEFWQAVADAVGGVLDDSGAEYEIKFEPARFRSRLINLCEALSTHPDWDTEPFMGRHFAFRAAVLRWTTDADMERAFKTRESSVIVGVPPGTPAWRLAHETMAAYLQVPQKHPNFEATLAQRKGLVDRIDFGKPVEASVQGRGKVTMVWHRKPSGFIYF